MVGKCFGFVLWSLAYVLSLKPVALSQRVLNRMPRFGSSVAVRFRGRAASARPQEYLETLKQFSGAAFVAVRKCSGSLSREALRRGEITN